MATVRTSPSLDALVPPWARHLRAANLSPRTVQSYAESARRLGAFLDQRGMPSEVSSIRREHVEAFIEHLLANWSPATTRHLLDKGIRVVEVDRPNRQERRRAGNSDPSTPSRLPRPPGGGGPGLMAKTRNGSLEAIPVLRVARSSARKDRVRALNQLRSLVSTAPEELRRELRDLSISRLVASAAGLRPSSAPTS